MKIENEAMPKMLIDIRARQSALNPAQRKVSEYVIEHFNELSGMQSSIIAQRCGVSEPTISRFVKEMGYDNYRDFQTKVAEANAVKRRGLIAESGYVDVSEDDSTQDICKTVFMANVQALVDTLSILDTQQLDGIVGDILAAGRVVIFAQGQSAVTGNNFRNRLLRIGIHCIVCSDPVEIAAQSAMANSGDLVLGISIFGRNRNVVEGMLRARGHNAKVVGLTSHRGFNIEQACDTLLYTVDSSAASSPLDEARESVCSTVTQTTLLDCLYMKIMQSMKEESRAGYMETIAAIKEGWM